MLKGKVAVVTGSTSGIGLGIAEALAAEGCDVVINGFGEPREIEALRSRIADDAGVRVLYSGADMSKPTEVRAMIEHATRELGHVDILVNNAGIQHVSPIPEFPEAKWRQIIEIMLTAPFLLTQAALPGMYARGWGRIINIGSVHSLRASAYKSAYVAAKHGLLGLTRVTALEAAEHGVTCNAICPSYVRTALVEKQIADQARIHGIPESEVVEKIMVAEAPIHRLLEPEEVAKYAAYLCSDDASGITGSAQVIDCGWTAH